MDPIKQLIKAYKNNNEIDFIMVMDQLKSEYTKEEISLITKTANIAIELYTEGEIK